MFRGKSYNMPQLVQAPHGDRIGNWSLHRPISVFRVSNSGVVRGKGAGAMAPAFPEKISMKGNGGPIAGCRIHSVTKYSGFQDAFVRFSFPVVPFRNFVS